MKNKPIIEVTGVGKKYNITHLQSGYVALRDVLAHVFTSPFAYIAHKRKHRKSAEGKEIFWALRDVHFSVEKGDIVGVIGFNGAGKSTLLKILSRITPPTEGTITLRGTVGSLLEVGTGFHPELTGRENIYLNGSILGMSRSEIGKKFNDIVVFAGIEKFLDTPVKRYSSGMHVRLAFSVAAHMEPDILLVDEVLAVGDIEFQKKCLGKMDEITKARGRTIIFVSHNMAAIQRLCNKTLLLKNGHVHAFGNTATVVEQHLSESQSQTEVQLTNKIAENTLKVENLTLRDRHGTETRHIAEGDDFSFSIDCFSVETMPVEIAITMESDDGKRIATLNNLFGDRKIVLPKEQHIAIVCDIKSPNVNKGIYTLSMSITHKRNPIYWSKNIFSFSITDADYYQNGYNPNHEDGPILLRQQWSARRKR